MENSTKTFREYQLHTLDLAKTLLGKVLLHETPDGLTSGRIVEVEAYIGPHDKAAHSYGGIPTPRTEVMYGPPGHAYVYQIYGLHYCFNVVSGPVNSPEAILVRALEPLEGIELMRKRRGIEKLRQLTNGPGKLAKAMGITKQQNGWSLTNSPLRICEGIRLSPDQISSGPRIGIEYAEEAKDYPWRFWIQGNPFVSK